MHSFNNSFVLFFTWFVSLLIFHPFIQKYYTIKLVESLIWDGIKSKSMQKKTFQTLLSRWTPSPRRCGTSSATPSSWSTKRNPSSLHPLLSSVTFIGKGRGIYFPKKLYSPPPPFIFIIIFVPQRTVRYVGRNYIISKPTYIFISDCSYASLKCSWNVVICQKKTH